MTTVPVLFPLSTQILFDANACPVKGGSVSFYDAETTNPRTVYRDAKMKSPHQFPVKTDYFGRIPPIWIGLGDYKAVMVDAVGAQIATIDDLPGGEDVEPADTMTMPIQTGMVIPAHTNDAFDGWLPLNGKTIGNSSSAGTARADDDTSTLFVKLWNQDGTLTVSNGGRGVSATADFAAAKTITLPDYRGRFFCGVDGMSGGALAGVITAATTATPDTVGTDIGAETIGLTVAQLPVHTPQVTLQNAGAHTHAVTLDQQGAHNHTGSTGSEGAHTHGYYRTNNNNVGGGSSGLANNSGNQANTDAGTAHVHPISADGAHTHNATVDSGNLVGSHAHTASAASIGSGQAHSNIPPAVMGYWLIKL